MSSRNASTATGREGHSERPRGAKKLDAAKALGVLLLVFVLVGFTYAVTTPIFEASDELWHYPFVRHLADGNPLPVQDPENVGPWKQEASQQPLYYALAAALTFWIDTSDMEDVRWLNPHVDNGVLTADGNTNLTVHRPEKEALPWRGTVLAVRLIRLVSVLMAAGTVYFTWRIASLIFPHRPALALGAAAVNAFTPMFLFISGAVNNDNLAVLLSSAGLYLVLLLSNNPAWRLRDSLLLGLVLGLGALTKTTCLGLLPLALLALLRSLWKQGLAADRRMAVTWLLKHGLAIILPVIALSGWWYLRNLRLYGDWLGWSAFIQVLGQRAHPASLRQLWSERWGFALSYWGLFGGVNVPMAEWVYHALNATGVLAAIGVLFWFVHSPRTQKQTWDSLWSALFLVLWTGAVFVGLLRWATVTWSSQGRLVFPAISAISILLVTGLLAWLPPRAGRLGAGLLAGGMFLLSAAAPFAWIAPAYTPPPPPAGEPQHPLEVNFDDRMRLYGFDLSGRSVTPGEQLDLTLYWEMLAPMERDWSVFVHLHDPLIEAPVAQRDMYPGQGLLATRLLEPGRRIANRYTLTVPGTTYAPAQMSLMVGLYDFVNGQRLAAEGGQDAVALAEIDLLARGGGEIPNPVHYNFGDQLALVGYHLEPRRVRPGETLTLTLFWQALTAMETDYTVFSHLRDLEDPSNRIYAQHDAPPPGGTSSWQPGEMIKAVYQLTLVEETPPAVHEIEIGVYYRDAEGNLSRLQLITTEGRPVDDFLILCKVRVD